MAMLKLRILGLISRNVRVIKCRGLLQAREHDLKIHPSRVPYLLAKYDLR